MKTSARNQFEGEVISVKKGVVGAIVKVSGPVVVTAFITKEPVEELEIKKGDRTTAIVKSTEVMIAKEVCASGKPYSRNTQTFSSFSTMSTSAGIST